MWAWELALLSDCDPVFRLLKPLGDFYWYCYVYHDCVKDNHGIFSNPRHYNLMYSLGLQNNASTYPKRCSSRKWRGVDYKLTGRLVRPASG